MKLLDIAVAMVTVTTLAVTVKLNLNAYRVTRRTTEIGAQFRPVISAAISIVVSVFLIVGVLTYAVMRVGNMGSADRSSHLDARQPSAAVATTDAAQPVSRQVELGPAEAADDGEPTVLDAGTR